MTVHLVTSRAARWRGDFDHWVSFDGRAHGLSETARLANLSSLLADAMGQVSDEWLALGRQLSQEPSAELAHAPSCAANASDLGQVLAWVRLVEEWAQGSKKIMLIVNDPWIARHLADMRGVTVEELPPLRARAATLWVRGVTARARFAARAAVAAATLRAQRKSHPRGASALLVYGHPQSEAGYDGYFGELMVRLTGLARVLHVDCGRGRAAVLGADGRTASLHAWGSIAKTFTLPLAKWRPGHAARSGRYGWLVRRAAALEGSTGQAAAIRWQQICHAQWLASARPDAIAWPWENHGWERDLVRRARAAGVRTIGYQHATVGRQEFNYSPVTNRDARLSFPDMILTAGPATRDSLLRIGIPADRVLVGGSFRSPADASVRYDPRAPIFVALPFDQDIAAEMVESIRALGRRGRGFLVKDHPMTPYAFVESKGVKRTDVPLQRHPALSAVVYAATTVGLEAVLLGLPTIQFAPESKVALDVLPDGIAVPTASKGELADALAGAAPPAPIDRARIFSSPDYGLWAAQLARADA